MLNEKPDLLFEVSSLFFIYKNQVQVVTHWELLVDVPHGGGQLISGKKQTDGNWLAWIIHKRKYNLSV